MKLRRFILSLCLVVCLVSTFTVSVSAVGTKYFMYSGIRLPEVPMEKTGYSMIGTLNGDYYCKDITDNYMISSDGTTTLVNCYKLIENEWVYGKYSVYGVKMFWSNVDLLDANNTSRIVLYGSSAVPLIGYSDFEGVVAKLKAQFAVISAVDVFVLCAVVAVGLVFMWWGVRKMVRSLMIVFRKGKISL